MNLSKQTLFNFLLIVIILLSSLQVNAQVITRVLSENDKIENYIPWYDKNEKSIIVSTPLVAVDDTLNHDRLINREMPRIGIKQDVNYTQEDGELLNSGNYSLWNMTLYSEGAKSMSIRFDNTNLPDNSEMYLFNEETKYIVGPITKSNFKNGIFRSDYINGDHVTISILIKNEDIQYEDIPINILSYDYGIIPFKSYDNNFNMSDTCNINFVCDGGMACQGESVCKIIHSSFGACSGALVNNDCCDLTPYILLAYHCVDHRPYEDFLFRFNYQSPTCEPTGETTPSEWITYYGSELKASWLMTDFALLQLNDKVGPGTAFSGWDRFNSSTPSSVCIHHPRGDVKKIAYDNDPNAFYYNVFHKVIWDEGTTEIGSSGSPLFNSDERIIGQLGGGEASCENRDSADYFGRFDISWEGGGSSNNRLKDWLGGSTNPKTMDCMITPYIEGPEQLCHEPGLYSLIYNMPCERTITWKVEPPDLFYPPTSGTETSIKLVPRPGAKGWAILTYKLSSPNCEDLYLKKKILVGEPSFDLFGDEYLCLGDVGLAFVDLISPDTGTIHWSIGGAIHGFGLGHKARYKASNNPGWGYVCASVSNDCGTTEKCLWIEVADCGWGKGGKGYKPDNSEIDDNLKKSLKNNSFSIYPNPSNDVITLSFPDINNAINKEIIMIDVNGKITKSLKSSKNQFKIDINSLPTGVYIIKCKINNNVTYQKFIKS